ncbi:MAG: hypothetical protein GEU83_00970 [Pseudonocardiaceae bacterium]|nr:hypothetical protein [Pseudonocardiaceae bacterium]
MRIVRELVDELQDELVAHRRAAIAVATAVLVLFLAGGIASIAGSDVAVALIAAVGMVGSAVAVLVLTARNALRR